MSSLFAELKRRNVVRVGIAYVILGWVIIQVADTVFPQFGFPEWTNQFVTIVIALGLPIALLLSWAFEMTPQGVMKTEEVDADASITHNTGQKLNVIIGAALVAALAFIAWQNMGPSADEGELVVTETPGVQTIAVMPFADMSAAGDQEYFGDGIAEELLNVLVKIDGLRVTSRTSSFAFKGQSGISLAEIGKALNVDHVLEGSVRTSGDMVRITAQLIDVRTDTHLWSETYDRSISNIFAIQDEISHAIVDALKVTLGTGNETMVEIATTSSKAYNLYLRGLYEFAQRFEQRLAALEKAIPLFTAATVIDPDYADAFAILGRD